MSTPLYVIYFRLISFINQPQLPKPLRPMENKKHKEKNSYQSHILCRKCTPHCEQGEWQHLEMPYDQNPSESQLTQICLAPRRLTLLTLNLQKCNMLQKNKWSENMYLISDEQGEKEEECEIFHWLIKLSFSKLFLFKQETCQHS